MRRVDKLGRIVIPLELREKYGLTEGAAIEFLDSGNGVIVKSSKAYCAICKKEIQACDGLPLCDGCIEKIIKEHKGKQI